VEQEPQPALVTEAGGAGHLLEQVWGKEKHTCDKAPQPGYGTERRGPHRFSGSRARQPRRA